MPYDQYASGLEGGEDGNERWGQGYGRDTGADADHLYQFGMPDPAAYNAEAGRQRAAAEQQFNQVASGEQSYARAMMHQGQGQAARQMAAGAVGRGSNPLAQRAALLGGAQASQQSGAQMAQLRAQEMQRARMARMETGDQLRQGEFAYAQLEAEQQRAAANHYAQMAAAAAAERGQDLAIAGAGIQAGGDLMGGVMASGEDLKRSATLLSDSAQDRMMRAYQERLKPTIRLTDSATYRRR